jgi:hypothetical protein
MTQITMTLIDSQTREPLTIGQTVTTFRGDQYVLTGWMAPHKPEASGKVYVQGVPNVFDAKQPVTREFYASVIGAEFFPRTDRL